MEQLVEQTEITLVTFIQDLAVYNAWANQRLVNWLKTKPASLMDKEVASSFPSIKETLVHIWDTQRFWLAVLQQVPYPPSFRMTGFDGTLEDVYEGIVDQSYQLADYLETITADSLLEMITFTTPWVDGTRSRLEFAQHCLNHSTYHRGQITTIGRHVDLTDAPMTDYSYYFLRAK